MICFLLYEGVCLFRVCFFNLLPPEYSCQSHIYSNCLLFIGFWSCCIEKISCCVNQSYPFRYMFCWDWCQQPVPKDTKGISPASQPCSQAMPATGFAYATLLYGSGDRSLIFSSDSAGLIWYEKKLVKAWVHLICRLQCILYMKYLNTYIFCPCRIGLFLITFWRGITILLSSSLDMWWLRWPSWFIQPRLISLLNMIEIIPRVPKWSIMVN